MLPAGNDNTELDEILKLRLDSDRPWVLIGGPPCQAYSLVGRSRNKGKANYSAEGDHRNFLYKQYLRIIKERQPAVFVMENVKGILSSEVGGEGIFARILQDLVDPNKALGGVKPGTKYRICSLVSEQSYGPDDSIEDLDPRAFIIRAEEYGIPQARHRVILLGIALDENANIPPHDWLQEVREKVPAGKVLQGLPKLRSRLSKQTDGSDSWSWEVNRNLEDLRADMYGKPDKELARAMDDVLESLSSAPKDVGSLRVSRSKGDGRTASSSLDSWFLDESLEFWLNHAARGHMVSDLRRYVFASTYARAHGISPKGHQQFSLRGLAPAHKNWESGNFSDRFRVQLEHQPSTTITSHISKDGHYFIHYDPVQCRSLTVREAARLQTFPDNYFFQGNRTQQFHQVGNAVPPLLANKIASVVFGVINQRTKNAAAITAIDQSE